VDFDVHARSTYPRRSRCSNTLTTRPSCSTVVSCV
jgi:hypothetical protein